jgi:hypothetical protein
LVATTCANCPLFPTKLEANPPPVYLSQAISNAAELEENHQLGATYGLDDLSPRQWCAMRAITRARAKSDKQRFKPKKDNNSAAKDRNQQQLQSGMGVID